MTNRRCLSAGLLVVFAGWPDFASAQTMPGFHVEVYATVLDPMRFDFAPNGDLYCGRDLFGSGGLNSDATMIWHIAVGGSPVTALGANILDPDALAFDASGTFTGVPGSVLVGGFASGPNRGLLTVVEQNGTTTPLFAQTGGFQNPSEMRVDTPRGRLLFIDPTAATAGVWQMTSTAYPTLLIPIPQLPSFFAIDGQGRVYSSSNDGVVRLHGPTGNLINASFVSLGALHALEVGIGGAFGTDLYAVRRTGGQMIAADATGATRVVGTGFGTIEGFRFGPDGALYVAEFNRDRILRITPRSADLASMITATPDPALRGGEVLYQLTVSNLGADAADGTELRIVLPDLARATLISINPSSGSCAPDGLAQLCLLGTLPSSATATVTARMLTMLAGTLTASVSAESSTYDPILGNNAASITTVVVEPPLDAGQPDTGELDAGGSDAGELDADAPDVEAPDAQDPREAGVDAGTDAGSMDAPWFEFDYDATSVDSASMDAAAPPADSGADGGMPGDDATGDEGCQCSARHAAPSASPLVLLLGLGALGWARRRSRR